MSRKASEFWVVESFRTNFLIWYAPKMSFQYVNNVPKWGQGCEMPSSMSSTTDITTLETSIHQHQSLYENMCQSYTEVHSTSKKLLYQLDHLVQTCSNVQNADHKKQVSGLAEMESQAKVLILCCDSFQEPRHSGVQGPKKDSAEDYTEGASHVLAVIHDILAQHRALEAKWHAKKIKLHQRLALRLFQEDVKQVGEHILAFGQIFAQVVSTLFSDIPGFGLATKSRRSVLAKKCWHWQKSAESSSLSEKPRNFRRSRSGKKTSWKHKIKTSKGLFSTQFVAWRCALICSI